MKNLLPVFDFDTADTLDRSDPLREFRDEFIITNDDLIYLDGNSLGRLSLTSQIDLAKIVQHEWGDRLIRSWNERWYSSPEVLGNKIGQIIGASAGTVIVCDSTSVNLYKVLLGALELQEGRKKIVSDDLNFPSDLYIIQGCVKLLGGRHRIHLVKSRDGISINGSEILDAIDDETALVVLSLVSFKSGFLYDAEKITQKANQVGALIVWDLSHAAGVVPVELSKWGVHFAVGCTYKYMNGGPGAPAFLYASKKMQESVVSPIWGWFGQHRPFDFNLDYKPASGINRFQSGTPPILSLLSIHGGVDLIIKAGISSIRTKSVLMGDYFLGLYDQLLAPLGFELGSPRDSICRGSHVSIRHLDGYQINQALIEEMNLIPDFREPDHIRLGFSPLYTTFKEILEGVKRIQSVVVEGKYKKYSNHRSEVT